MLGSSTKVAVEGGSTKMSGDRLFSSRNLFGRLLISPSVPSVTLKKFVEWLLLTLGMLDINFAVNIGLAINEKSFFPTSFDRFNQ